MRHGTAFIVDARDPSELPQRKLAAYDREIGIQLLYKDPTSGDEHYLVHYSADLKARIHRHSGAQTIVVLDGRMTVNDRVIGPGGFCHFPAGEPMLHEPAGGQSCLFVSIFHGSSDVEVLED